MVLLNPWFYCFCDFSLKDYAHLNNTNGKRAKKSKNKKFDILLLTFVFLGIFVY